MLMLTTTPGPDNAATPTNRTISFHLDAVRAASLHAGRRRVERWIMVMSDGRLGSTDYTPKRIALIVYHAEFRYRPPECDGGVH